MDSAWTKFLESNLEFSRRCMFLILGLQRPHEAELFRYFCTKFYTSSSFTIIKVTRPDSVHASHASYALTKYLQRWNIFQRSVVTLSFQVHISTTSLVSLKNLRSSLRHSTYIYRVSQEECARLRESVPYVKLYRYNPKHLYPRLNGYGDNGHRKVWASGGSTYCTPSVTPYSSIAHARQRNITS